MLRSWAVSVSSFFAAKTVITLENLLSTTDRKLAMILDNNIDKLRKDASGLDPFGTRVRQKTPRINLHIRDLLAQFNICGDNTDSFNWIELEPSEKTDIPAVVHFIWLGSALIDEDERRKEMKRRIETWRKHNPKFPIIIWTDQTNKSAANHLTPSMADMKLWCSTNNIALVNVEDVFSGNMELEALFLLELQLQNFGATSDILRKTILLCFGGTYSDIDITCRAPLNLKSKTGFRINGGKSYKDTAVSPLLSTLMNDVIQSIPNHPILLELLSDIATKYSQTFAEIYAKTGIILNSDLRAQSIPYEIALGLKPKSSFFYGVKIEAKAGLQITVKQLRRVSTISRSGPGVYVRVLQNKRLEVDYEHVPDQDFDFQSISSWLEHFSDRETYSEPERIQIVKHILNGILRDLQDEPHFLRFDQYAKIINKYQIANLLLYLLAKHFPEKLQNVLYANFYEACDNINALKFISDNKEFFPKLNLDKEGIMADFMRSPKLFALQWFKENLQYEFNALTTDSSSPLLTRLCQFGIFKSFEQFKIIFTEAIQLGATVNPDPLKGISPLGVICGSHNEENFLDKFNFILQHTNGDGLNCFQENPLCNLLKNPLNGTAIIAVKKLLARHDIDVSMPGCDTDYGNNVRSRGTPLHYAVRNLDIAAIQLLLEHHPEDMRCSFTYNHSRLQIANLTVMELIDKLCEVSLQEMQKDSPELPEKQKKLDQIRGMLKTCVHLLKLGDLN